MLAVTGCGGTVDADPIQTTAAVEQASADYSAVIAAYRKRFPALAEGRSDKGLSNDVKGTCFAISEGKDDDVLRTYVAGRFAGQDGTAPTPEQADAIIALVRGAC